MNFKELGINEEIIKKKKKSGIVNPTEIQERSIVDILNNKDVIVIASVSCIYGIGEIEEYKNKMLTLNIGEVIDRDVILEKLIELKNIVKAYGDNVVVNNMNLYVNDNEFITFLGPSGCGKTTTTHTLGVGLGMKGYKILLVDADAQCNLSSVSNIDISNNKTLYEVMKGEVEPQDAIQHTKYYDIIGGSLNMTRADTEFTKEPYIMNCFYLMKEQIDKIW